jgi:hypothetical protein
VQRRDRRAHGRISAIGEHVAGERIPERAVVGGRRQQPAQAVATGEHPLRPQARVLAPGVDLRGVVEAPVGLAGGVQALDQPVTQLVQHHLRHAVVGVERVGRAQAERAVAARDGVRVGRAVHAQADRARDAQPQLVERIDVAAAHLARRRGGGGHGHDPEKRGGRRSANAARPSSRSRENSVTS